MSDCDPDLKVFGNSCEKIAESVTSANKAMGNLLPKIQNSLELSQSVEEIKIDVKKILIVLKDMVTKNDLKEKFRQFERNQFIREENRLRFRTNQINFEWLNVRFINLKKLKLFIYLI